MHFLKQFLLSTLVLAVFSTPVLAARAFTPQAGLWMIPSENNGQPGRGFSLDVQGSTAFLQVFNYAPDGAATFHTAVGQLDAAASMTVPLLRFKGGRYLGGPARDAMEAGSAGNVTVRFSDGLNGSVQFPGEDEQPIARFLVPEKLPYWWSQLSQSPPSNIDGSRSMVLIAYAPNNTRYVWNGILSKNADDTYRLTFLPTQRRIHVVRTEAPAPLDCVIDKGTQVLDCLLSKAATSGATAASALGIHRMRFRFLGHDIVGVIQPEADLTSRLVLNGTTSISQSQSTVNGRLEFSRRTYSMSGLMEDDCIYSCVGMGATHSTILPTSGAWIIEAENHGMPGRGIFLDIQDETVIVQTSDYLPNGEATFHMGAGVLTSSNTLSGDTTASMSLFQYGGGRYFGGPAQTGREVSRDGELKLAFSPIYGTKFTDFATGDIQLPKESTQRIKRLQFEPTMDVLQTMLGEYLVNWETWEGIERHEERWLRLTRIEGEFAKNDDGTVQCRRWHTTEFNEYSMYCIWHESPDAAYDSWPWLFRAEVQLVPFQRDASTPTLRTRDRHGNWLGLGAVNLPGLAIPVN